MIFDATHNEYDLSKYPLPQIVLSTVQKYYPDVDNLQYLHEYVPKDSIGELVKCLTKDLADTNFYVLFDKMVEEYVLPKLNTDILIQKFGNVRITVPNQDQNGTVLPFHQGRWVGNGLGLRTVWLPFTETFDSNSLQIIGIDKSREITKKSTLEKWSYESLQNVCLQECYPVNMSPGNFLLFTQENIHGGIPNRTGKTRMSIDVRLLLRNGQPHRKWPGAYFRKLNDTNIQSRKIKILPEESIITYAEYEGFKTRHIDLYFQTLTVREYCNRMGYKFPHQTGDNEGRDHTFLEYSIKNTQLNHIILFSIFSLPDDKFRRSYIMNLALEHNCKLHFANEEFVLDSQEMMEKIEYLRSFTTDWSNPAYEN
ncbi:hypothetical protein EB169_06685 [archaeon]|nr:hypothetical protein [archaeon]